MWLELISDLGHDVTFADPAAAEGLTEASGMLGGSLPSDLAGFLSESDGVTGEFRLGLIWPLARIIQDNQYFRSDQDFARLYMPFEPLLFFADAGNGDQFAFRWQTELPDIFAWDHESDSRIWVAPNLAKYLEWRLDGTIKT